MPGPETTTEPEKSKSLEQKPDAAERCRKAIVLYLEGLEEFRGKEVDPAEQKRIKERAALDADYLAKIGEDGLRYGTPTWYPAKLMYSENFDTGEKFFRIYPNGPVDEDFRKWESFIAQRFQANGLNFRIRETNY